MGNDTYWAINNYTSYHHSYTNDALILVIIKPEQIKALKHKTNGIRPVEDQPTDISPSAEKFKWHGLTNMIKEVAKRQDMTLSTTLYSQKWDYTAGVESKSKLFNTPAKPRDKDPREMTPRKPGEDAKDWLLRAVQQMKAKRNAEDRKLGRNWE